MTMSFFVIFEGLGTCFENKEEISNFMKMFYSLCVTSTKKNLRE